MNMLSSSCKRLQYSKIGEMVIIAFNTLRKIGCDTGIARLRVRPCQQSLLIEWELPFALATVLHAAQLAPFFPGV
jgi:hypothetical protein